MYIWALNQTSSFAATTGDKSAMQSFADLLWILVLIIIMFVCSM